jgi:hypothetical protein
MLFVVSHGLKQDQQREVPRAFYQGGVIGYDVEGCDGGGRKMAWFVEKKVLCAIDRTTLLCTNAK